MCCGCSKEPSQLDGSFEYPQHMLWLRNKKKNFSVTHSYQGPEYIDQEPHSVAIVQTVKTIQNTVLFRYSIQTALPHLPVS